MDVVNAMRMSGGFDPRYMSEYERAGFEGFVELGDAVAHPQDLLRNPAYELESCGVYAIFAPLEWIAGFAQGRQSNVINPWPLHRLQAKWVPDVELIYIGCAGRTASSRPLRKRLGDLLRHGAGKVSTSGPHKGGERLWQCEGWESFRLAWRSTGLHPEPHALEVAIGSRFLALTGALPFANVAL